MSATGRGKGVEGPPFPFSRGFARAWERRQAGVRPGPPRLPNAFFGPHNTATARFAGQPQKRSWPLKVTVSKKTQADEPESQPYPLLRQSVTQCITAKGAPERVVAHGRTEGVAAHGCAERVAAHGCPERVVAHGRAEGIAAHGCPEGVVAHGCAERVVAQGRPEGIVAHGRAEGVVAQGCPEGSVAHGRAEGIVAQGCPEGIVAQGCPEGIVAQGCPEGIVAQGCPERVVAQGCPERVAAQGCPEGIVSQGVAKRRIGEELAGGRVLRKAIKFGRLGPPRDVGFLYLYVAFTDLLCPIPCSRSNRAREVFARRRVEEAEVPNCGQCNQNNTAEKHTPFDLPVVIANLHTSLQLAEFLVAHYLKYKSKSKKLELLFCRSRPRSPPERTLLNKLASDIKAEVQEGMGMLLAC